MDKDFLDITYLCDYVNMIFFNISWKPHLIFQFIYQMLKLEQEVWHEVSLEPGWIFHHEFRDLSTVVLGPRYQATLDQAHRVQELERLNTNYASIIKKNRCQIVILFENIKNNKYKITCFETNEYLSKFLFALSSRCPMLIQVIQPVSVIILHFQKIFP